MKDGIYRNTCPRNCYGTCGILSHVKNGKIIKVTGDPEHGYTKGKLCAKGYASTQFVYNPNRLKYPMVQTPRGSGNWKRISWDKAYTIIASKLIELNRRYGSNLASGYNKFSGNLGMLHYATEGMFNSFGPHTKPEGNPCALTGRLAINKNLGMNYSAVPEDMSKSKLIVIWGANPAVTNVHQMKFIYEARNNGAKLVVIDPIFTETAKKADLYIQIKPGTDAWLALGISKLLIEADNCDTEFLYHKTTGWNEFKKIIETGLNVGEVSEKTGVPIEAIIELSQLYGEIKPMATWNGLGIQRNDNGGHSVNAINSLSAITGNLCIPNAGLYYMHFDVEHFPLNLFNHQGPKHPSVPSSRFIKISDFASHALSLNDPPIKLLWIASRNILSQDQNIAAWEHLFNQLELTVVVDLYMTKTAEQADMVLPAKSHFEEEDLHVSYWHYWLSLNQKAIPSYFEAKSDLEIARELTKKLNTLSPGFSNFPYEKEPMDWIREELTPEIQELYDLNGWADLLKKPHKKKVKDHPISEGMVFQLYCPEKLMNKHVEESEEDQDVYRLLSPQSLLKIHSQYEYVTWLNHEDDNAFIEIHNEIALKHEIMDFSKIEMYNEYGSVRGIAKINPSLPKNVIVAPQAGKNPINILIKHRFEESTDDSSNFFYDSKVKIRKWSEGNV